MTVFALYCEWEYEGQQLLGVFTTLEAAEAAASKDEYVSEIELDLLYGVGDISYGETHEPRRPQRGE